MHRALVLSGGGAKGSWQVGACEHLIGERGVWFDIISGVSVGAINGTTLAHARDQIDLHAHLDRLRTVWFGMRGNDNVYRRRRFGVLGLIFGKWGGLYDTAPLRDEILGRELDPAQVAASPIRLQVGYVDLRSFRYQTAGNDHPRLREAVLASCSLPVLFPPVRLPGSLEIGVDGGVRNFAPLPGALHALAEYSPEHDPSEVWMIQLQCPCAASTEKMVRRCLQSAFPSLSLRADEPLANGVNCPQTVHSFLLSVVIRGRLRKLRLRVLHPTRELAGSSLDFVPAKIRAWYEDGLRSARDAETGKPGPGPVQDEEFAVEKNQADGRDGLNGRNAPVEDLAL